MSVERLRRELGYVDPPAPAPPTPRNLDPTPNAEGFPGKIHASPQPEEPEERTRALERFQVERAEAEGDRMFWGAAFRLIGLGTRIFYHKAEAEGIIPDRLKQIATIIEQAANKT